VNDSIASDTITSTNIIRIHFNIILKNEYKHNLSKTKPK